LTSKPTKWYEQYLRKSFCHHIEPQAVSLCSDPASGRVWVGSSDGQIVLYSLSSKSMPAAASVDAEANGSDDADKKQGDETSTSSSPSSSSKLLRACILKHGYNLPHANLNWVSEMAFDAGRNTLFAVSHDKIITVCRMWL
jgi:hypothetical protein